MKAINLAVGAFVCLTIGTVLGIILFVRMSPDTPAPADVPSLTTPVVLATETAPLFSPMQETPTQVAIPTPGAIGSTGYFTRSTGQYTYRLVWVNRTGLWAFGRAYDERDGKQMSQILGMYETLRVDDGTRVEVVNRDGEAVQVEMIDGPYSGRRGWLLLLRDDLSATPTVPPTPTPLPLTFAPGEAAYIRYSSSPIWWIPVNRQTYTAWERSGFQDPSPPGLDWILARGGTPVRILEANGSALIVEMTEGAYRGKRAWVPRGMLTNESR